MAHGYEVHALALAGFFGCALCRECLHVPTWNLQMLKHMAHNSLGETLYLFAVHVVVYSGMIVPTH